MLASDAAVLAAYELCVFTGPGFTTDYLQPRAANSLATEERGALQPQDASLKELSVLPGGEQPAGDEELGAERGGHEQGRVWEHCATCRVDKKWYSHHCFICNRCVIRMDHHCRRRG